MAELFRARFRGAEGFQKIVAVKKILPHIAGDEEFLTMFADEAKLAAQLNHPNIVHIFDLGKIERRLLHRDGVRGRARPAVDPASWRADTGAPMPIPLAVSIAARRSPPRSTTRTGGAATTGRELHIVHRDVLSAEHPRLDRRRHQALRLRHRPGGLEGLARPSREPSKEGSRTCRPSRPGASGVGSEQRHLFAGRGDLRDARRGPQALPGRIGNGILEKVRAGEVVAPSSLNPEARRRSTPLLLEALAREPDGRYANVSEMLRDLEAVLRTYEPPPSSAELAIYVHHLETEEAALKAARASRGRAAARARPAGARLPGRRSRVPAPRPVAKWRRRRAGPPPGRHPHLRRPYLQSCPPARRALRLRSAAA